MDDAPSPLGRLLGAGFVAAFAAVVPLAAVVAVADPKQPALVGAVFLAGVPYALLHVLLVGLPFYVLLRERWALTWPRALVGGFLVGSVPTGLLSVLLFGADPEVLWMAATPGGFGVVGAAAFRAVLGRPHAAP